MAQQYDALSGDPTGILAVPAPATHSPWRLSVAPMMAWTDQHCRFFHRLITRRTLLYTEMITTGALKHGDRPTHLDYNAEEHAVALQVGGNDPAELALSVRLARQWGYDEINLNCGCPSERVQRGAFGACLMKEAGLVADGVRAMLDAAVYDEPGRADIPVTVKHRIGVDDLESYEFVRDFVGTVSEAGCRVFIAHARSAWLKGLSPKENRDVPPLKYDVVHRLKRDFPTLTIVVNGGIRTQAQITEHLAAVDGVMVGREAYHSPWLMAEWDHLHFGDPAVERDRADIERRMVDYMDRQTREHDVPWPHMSRHMLGLWNGTRGARLWRQIWSDFKWKDRPVHEVWQRATEARSG